MKTVGEVAREADPIRELNDYLVNSKEAIPPPSTLETLVMMKRAEAFIKAAREELLEAANREYQSIKSLEPKVKRHSVAGGKAYVSDFTPRAVWDYPEEIQQIMDEAKARQKQAQADGTAVKVNTEIDPSKSALFAVTLNEKF